MSETADLEELARRYLDLWQDQMRVMASDPELMESLERLLRAWGMPTTPAGGGFTGPFGAGQPGGGQAGVNPMAALLATMQGPMGAAGATSDGGANPWMAWPAAMMAMMQQANGVSPSWMSGAAGGHGTKDRSSDATAEAGSRGSDAQPAGGSATAGAGAQAGSASAAAASDGGAGDMEQLAVRLAALEERLAAVEKDAGSRGGSRRPAAKPASGKQRKSGTQRKGTGRSRASGSGKKRGS